MDSVKVGVRVRPLSENELKDGCTICLSYPLEEGMIMIGNDKLFTYDFVFNERSSQQAVYTRAALPMVENILKGYNATVFTYGQTGSGKTYTMGTGAPEDQSEFVGIVPRIIQDLFSRMSESDYDYTIRASFLEIYKEDIHDLLGDDLSTPLQIREDNQMIKIPGLTEVLVTGPEEVLSLLHAGATKRTVGGTAMNVLSSRSHAIFTLSFVIRPRKSSLANENSELVKNDETLVAKLHLVDLAGSERIKRTHAEGDRLKEGININRGLLALGNVISALCERDSKKRSHIPYRDSKLTRLLQDSLGGNSTTLMLACVSPADCNMEETLNTLRYADRARMIKNKPILNRADPKDAELAKLRALVLQLQSQISSGVNFPLMSPCPKIIKAPQSSASQFSSELVSRLMEKNKKLEDEKKSVCEELDRVLEETSDLYNKVFEADTLRDVIRSEIDKFKKIMDSIESLIGSESIDVSEIHNIKRDMEAVLNEVNNTLSGITKSKLDELYEQCLSTNEASQLMDVDLQQEPIRTDGCVDAIAAIAACSTEDLVRDKDDRRGSELRARRLACKQRIETIEANLRQKNVLLASLEAAAEQGEESYCRLLEQYESQIRELESRISSLEAERAKVLSEYHSAHNQNPAKLQQQSRLQAMECELTQARRQLTELSRLKKAKEARESECLRLRDEIQSLKVSMVRTAKQLKEESGAYRRWRLEKEQEVRKLQEHDRRLQSEMSRMAAVHERQQAVLKRRIEAAAASERRLKDLLCRQREIRNDREKFHADVGGAKGKLDMAMRVRTWVSNDLDVQVSMAEVRHHLSRLIESRRELCEQLRSTEAKFMAAKDKGENYDVLASEVATLTDSIQTQTQQIGDLQQKLLDAGERTSDVGSSVGSMDQALSSRLAQLHNIQEARIALKYLFKEAVASQSSKIALETQLSDLQSQLAGQQDEMEKLRSVAAAHSAQSEEMKQTLSAQLEEANHRIQQLQHDIEQLRSAAAHTAPMFTPPASNVTTTNPAITRNLSVTPVFRQHRNFSDVSTQYTNERKRQANIPTILVPDSTRKQSRHSMEELDFEEIVPANRMKLRSSNEQGLPATVVSNDATSTRAVRCKCRGTCSVRCGCKRSGEPCLPDLCKCVLGICQNRDPEHSTLAKPDDTEVMKPPAQLPPLQNLKKRKTRPLHLNTSTNNSSDDDEVQTKKSPMRDSTAMVLNQTFELKPDNLGYPNHLASPDLSQTFVDGGVKQLWPKNRLSYFPSPFLRPTT